MKYVSTPTHVADLAAYQSKRRAREDARAAGRLLEQLLAEAGAEVVAWQGPAT